MNLFLYQVSRSRNRVVDKVHQQRGTSEKQSDNPDDGIGGTIRHGGRQYCKATPQKRGKPTKGMKQNERHHWKEKEKEEEEN